MTNLIMVLHWKSPCRVATRTVILVEVAVTVGITVTGLVVNSSDVTVTVGMMDGTVVVSIVVTEDIVVTGVVIISVVVMATGLADGSVAG